MENEDEGSFQERMREIHTELTGLNAEAVELSAKISMNLEELGI